MYKIFCANCRADLYRYNGEFVGEFDPRLFVPANPTVMKPAKGREMVCHKCGQAWYMLRETGSIVVFTDRGWKPSPPRGPAKIFDPESFVLAPEMPSKTGHDFVPPTPTRAQHVKSPHQGLRT